jgi:outer membrane protein assembly factor BamA
MKTPWAFLLFMFALIFGLLVQAAPCLAQDMLFVQTISILGAEKSKEALILRELNFSVGDSVAFDELEELMALNQRNVYNLLLFNDVSFIPEVLNDRLYVIITLKERWYIFPYPRLKLEERNTYDFLKNPSFDRVSFGLGLNWRNVTGWNETLNIKTQLGFTQRLTVEYIRPALFYKENIDLLATFRFINEKEVIVRTEEGIPEWENTVNEPLQQTLFGSLALRKRFSVTQSIEAELNFKQVRFSDSIYIFNDKFIPSSDGKEYYPSIVLTFADDKRDLKNYPLQGIKYQFIFRFSGPPGLASTSFVKVGGSFAHHIPLSRRLNFSYGFHQMFAFGDRIPFYEKNFIGIDRKEFRSLGYNLRGYERYAIDGAHVSMLKGEWKIGVFPRRIIHIRQIPFERFQDFPFGLYLTVYSDLGYVADPTFNNQDTFLKNRLLAGYGIGLNLIGIYDTLFRIEYSRNHFNEGGVYFHASISIK